MTAFFGNTTFSVHVEKIEVGKPLKKLSLRG
jgi:hypothetical protein